MVLLEGKELFPSPPLKHLMCVQLIHRWKSRAFGAPKDFLCGKNMVALHYLPVRRYR